MIRKVPPVKVSGSRCDGRRADARADAIERDRRARVRPASDDDDVRWRDVDRRPSTAMRDDDDAKDDDARERAGRRRQRQRVEDRG